MISTLGPMDADVVETYKADPPGTILSCPLEETSSIVRLPSTAKVGEGGMLLAAYGWDQLVWMRAVLTET